jgi:tetratricopeptide (TPR) repeat protein
LAATIGRPRVDDWGDLLEDVPGPIRDVLNGCMPTDEEPRQFVPMRDGRCLLAWFERSFCWIAPADTTQSAPLTWITGPHSAVVTDALNHKAAFPWELGWALFELCERTGDWDEMLELGQRGSHAVAGYFKARALTGKGMTDAALVAYDDVIKENRKTRPALTNLARYWKAALLLERGDRAPARRELARLFADDPKYDDYLGLQEQVELAREPHGRAVIAEEVRHAVWRRDGGRCVQCGSQENLEFDHIIPVARGGASTERNLQLLCETCNRRKGAAI